jgi:RimJ/RimL family protein N-acetyltransferase
VPQETFPPLSLSEDGVTLRRLTEADVDAVAEFCADPLIQTWLPLPSPYTVEAARWFVTEFANQQQESGRGLVLGIEAENRPAGAIDLTRTDWASRNTEIGYWLGPWARGRGVMRSAVAQLALWALQEQHFERIELRIATGHVASQRVADSCGFVHEGVLRNAGSIHAGRVDLIVYSLIPGDLLEEPE